ncbi:hypothetical protein QQ045_023869 [Rhodiola kirilowii]
MANKIVAVFLMCFFLASAISVQARVKPYIDYAKPVKPDEFKPYIDFVPVKPTQVKPYVDYLPVKPTVAHEEPVLFRFAKCFETCKSECLKLQDEYSCEMKCDSECSAKEFADKLGVKI